MTDAELVAAFEAAALTRDDFTHANHIRVAWWYLRRDPLPAALDRITRGLDRLTRRLGVPHLYHETITYAYVFLVNERLERTGRDVPWPEFAAANPDLLARGKAALLGYYRHGELDSDLARKIFVLPGPA